MCNKTRFMSRRTQFCFPNSSRQHMTQTVFGSFFFLIIFQKRYGQDFSAHEYLHLDRKKIDSLRKRVCTKMHPYPPRTATFVIQNTPVDTLFWGRGHKFVSSAPKNAQIVWFFRYKSRNDFYVAWLRDGQTYICLKECHFYQKIEKGVHIDIPHN